MDTSRGKHPDKTQNCYRTGRPGEVWAVVLELLGWKQGWAALPVKEMALEVSSPRGRPIGGSMSLLALESTEQVALESRHTWDPECRIAWDGGQPKPFQEQKG